MHHTEIKHVCGRFERSSECRARSAISRSSNLAVDRKLRDCDVIDAVAAGGCAMDRATIVKRTRADPFGPG